MTFLLDVVVPLLVIFVMTICGMNVRYEDFSDLRRYPVRIPLIVIGHWIALTAVAGVVGRILHSPPAVAAGMLLVAAAPVATLSNYYTQLARGNLALAVAVTAVSNVVAVVATPLVASTGFQVFLGEAAAFDLPLARVAQQTLFGLLLPLCLGMTIRHRAPAWTTRWNSRLQRLAMLAIAGALAFVLMDQFAAISDQLAMLFGAAAVFTLAMLATGAIAALLTTRVAADRRALAWGFPARNVAVAALIATSTVDRIAVASFVAALFATQVAIMIPLAAWLGRRAGERQPAVP
jgi:bile acid:Na+ symporter, BASS family